MQLIIRKVTVLSIQIFLKIRPKDYIILFTMNVISALILPATVFKQLKDGQLIVVLVILKISHITGLLLLWLLLSKLGKCS